MEKLEIKTPAKINFGLNVVKKRDDGFHDIISIFYPIDFFDYIEFKKSTHTTIICNVDSLRNTEDNLITKAIRVLENQFNKSFNLEIFLQKSIPMGAGLGGGSSDAAATLLALNKLFKLKLTADQLRKFAMEIGSDVPFFINPVPSLAGSRGEILREFNFNINFPILLVTPNIHVSTKWAYRNIIPKKPVFDLSELDGTVEPDFKILKQKIQNDFEIPVFQRYSAIKQIKQQLYKSGALFALMSGSGSSLFGIFPNLVTAQNAKKKFDGKYITHIKS